MNSLRKLTDFELIATAYDDAAPESYERLEFLLDLAKIPKKAGRLKQLAEIAEVSPAGARKWIDPSFSKLPKPQNLVALVKNLLDRVDYTLDITDVCIWIISNKGDPFPNVIAPTKNLEHSDLNRIHVEVHNTAKELNVDLYGQSERKINSLFYKLLPYCEDELCKKRNFLDSEEFRDTVKMLLKLLDKDML